MTNQDENLLQAARAFDLPGKPVSVLRYGSGLVHRSFLLTCREAQRTKRFLMQDINTYVFRDPQAVMENIRRVLDHIRLKSGSEYPSTGDSREVMDLVVTKTGKDYHIDEDNRYWRIYRFIDNSRGFDEVSHPGLAFEAARMFGRFAGQLSDLEPSGIHTTIPHFHDLSRRYSQLANAVRNDTAGRFRLCREEIACAARHEELEKKFRKLVSGKTLPVRITHNDTKISNVLMDADTGRGLCVIDLDTVMPSTILSDFGDMMRTFLPPAGEEETDLKKIEIRLPVFKAMAEGFLNGCGSMITRQERTNLIFGGQMMTLMQAIRFLTDFLEGDRYYSIQYEDHNLSRARNQFRLLECMVREEKRMRETMS